jgi:hypothetical protein
MAKGLIRFTQRVVFKDCTGTVTKVYEVGDTEEFFGKTSTYYITSMGGIYFDEAEEVSASNP